MLCDDLEGWGWGVGGAQEKGDVYCTYTDLCVYPIHFTVQQKLTQRCKAVIPQLKKRMKKRRTGSRLCITSLSLQFTYLQNGNN